MRRTRAHQPSRAERLTKFRAQLTADPMPIHLLAIDRGGFTFWLSENEGARIHIGDTIKCRISPEGGPEVDVKASVLYFYPYPQNGQAGQIFGAKPLSPDDEIQNLLDLMRSSETSEGGDL